jgi:Uma2 family endonuclease
MDTLAPWAEPVLMTADELLRLPEDGWHYELVEGRLVRMSPTGRTHGRALMGLLGAVYSFVQERELGEVLPAETGFWISAPGEPDTVLAPDLAYVRSGRLPAEETPGFIRLAPDLVAEVASPSQGRRELAAKARRWSRAGVRVIWLVMPNERVVEVWRDGELVETDSVGDELSGEDVLPGFRLPVAQIFG